MTNQALKSLFIDDELYLSFISHEVLAPFILYLSKTLLTIEHLQITLIYISQFC